MVCLRNISVDTLYKGETDDDDDDNKNNNNNNNNNIKSLKCNCFMSAINLTSLSLSPITVIVTNGEAVIVVGEVSRLRAGRPRHRGSILCVPKRLDGTSNLLRNGYRGLLPQGQSCWGAN
jgi:hypothetical protein